MRFGKQCLRVAGVILLIQLVLVATHRGEFWPFSIYPMFSQAGDPFVRSLAREVPSDLNPDSLETVHRLADLPGEPFALESVGTNKNDLANFVQKNKEWNRRQIDGLRSLFEPKVNQQHLVVYKVTGKLQEGQREIAMAFTPFAYLTPDTSFVFSAHKLSDVNPTSSLAH